MNPPRPSWLQVPLAADPTGTAGLRAGATHSPSFAKRLVPPLTPTSPNWPHAPLTGRDAGSPHWDRRPPRRHPLNFP